MALVMALCMSLKVEAVTRALKVEALSPCSVWRIRQTSKIRATSGSGSVPKSM